VVEAPILDADVFNLLARAAAFGERLAPNVYLANYTYFMYAVETFYYQFLVLAYYLLLQ
jgi:hypothetical protein